MLTFKEAIDSLKEGEKPSILLANGFSQAFSYEIFNYENLFKAADFKDRETVLKSLFERMETYDFEVVMKQLVAAESVLDAYGVDVEILNKIRADKSALKEALISAISETHPNLPSDISNEQYETVRRFLFPFNKVFTLNYDLLFYWARNKRDLEPENYTTDDGFRQYQRWEIHNGKQNVYFLHGGLHIYDTNTYIKKYAYKESGKTIIEQVRDNLNKEEFPLFVSEPTHTKKKNRIEHNPYLNYCFKALRKVNGALFVYGHSMDKNDKHIFDQIKNSGVSKVFVSIYGDENNAENTKTKANANAYLTGKGINVYFYRADSTPVWRQIE